MKNYKKLFIDAKVKMDERLSKERIEELKEKELGKKEAEKIFNNNDMESIISEQLDEFIQCMGEDNMKPPFVGEYEVNLEWNDKYMNSAYMCGLMDGIKSIFEIKFKQKLPGFCECSVDIKDNIKVYYHPLKGSLYAISLLIQIKLAFKE